MNKPVPPLAAAVLAPLAHAKNQSLVVPALAEGREANDLASYPSGRDGFRTQQVISQAALAPAAPNGYASFGAGIPLTSPFLFTIGAGDLLIDLNSPGVATMSATEVVIGDPAVHPGRQVNSSDDQAATGRFQYVSGIFGDAVVQLSDQFQ